MRRHVLGALALLVSVPAAVVVGAPAASAAGLSVGSIAGFVADDAEGRVFVGDAQAGKVLAADYDGTLVDSTSVVPGVAGLALSPDGRTLYASSWSTHEVVALDASTLDEVARYTVATTYGPRHLAFAGGKVWFSYGDQWDGNLGSIDPVGGAVTMDQYPNRVWGQALLDTAAARPDLLAVGETGISTDSMAVLDTSGTTPTEVAFYRGDYTLNNGIHDIDLVPGADQVLVNGRERQAWSGEGTFAPSGAYPNGARADISATGLVATATDQDVRVFKPGNAVALNVFDGGAARLTWSGDESRLFALRGTGPFTLDVIDDPSSATPDLAVEAPASATRGKPLTVSGTLTSETPFTGPVTLTVRRQDLEHPAGLALAPVTVASNGAWSLTDTPTVGGTVTYVVDYAGDAGHRAVTGSAKVTVPRRTPFLTLSPGSGTYAYGREVTYTAHLGSTGSNRRVEIWADPAGADRPRTLLRGGVVDSNGDLRVRLTLRRNTTVSAVYAGDGVTSPRTVSVKPQTKVALSMGVSGHYRTAPVGGVSYRWFHRTDWPVLTTTMTAYSGRAARMDFQVLVDGQWRSADSAYYLLGPNGRLKLSVESPDRAGIKARVRAAYVKGGSGDSVNATTLGKWAYLYWTR